VERFATSDEFARIFLYGLDPEGRKAALEMVVRVKIVDRARVGEPLARPRRQLKRLSPGCELGSVSVPSVFQRYHTAKTLFCAGLRHARRGATFPILGGAAVAWPLAASAQQPRVITIGILVRSAPGWERFWQSFPEALKELGYIEGQNIRFEFRSDEGQMSRLPQLAAELVRLNVDIIVPWFTPAASAAKQATREVPIVCAARGDMVGTGLVDNLARPGGNVTGNSSLNAEVAARASATR
jgi:hypothetical protein